MEISRQLATAKSTILKYLKQYNIPVRGSGANIRRKRGLAYGAKCLQRKEAQHKKELENIKKMRELRDKGFSYWKIASVFNAMKIPTKTRKGRWHARTVQAILNNKQSV